MANSRPLTISVFLVSLAVVACSSDANTDGTIGAGGSTANVGGSLGTGGAATGGSSTGGTTSGGTTSGGTASGGTDNNSGGVPGIGGGTGGESTGGAPTGGSGGEATGGEATGGTGSGGNAPLVVTPEERGGMYVFEFDDIIFEVDPAVGARVSSFSYGGEDVLFPGTSTDTESSNWGSTFWTSPQAVWSWPPPVAINVGPYSAEVADNVVTMTSADYALGDTTVTIEKSFSATSDPAAITIVYKINNTGSTAVSVAGWEISRVALGGISFFPEGPGGTASSPNNNLLPTVVDGDVVWFDEANAGYRNATDNSGNNKMNGDGAEGWIAHATDSLLFVKTFTEVPDGATAPDHGELELYASSAGDYVEVENQGIYGEIDTGESISYSVRWALRPLSATLEVGKALAEEARAIASEVGTP